MAFKWVKKPKKDKAIRFQKKFMVASFIFIVIYVCADFFLSYRAMTTFSDTLTTCFFAYFSVEGMANAWIKVTELKGSRKDKNDGMASK